MFNKKTLVFSFSVRDRRKSNHINHVSECATESVLWLCLLVRLERLAASAFNLVPFQRSHLVCFQRSTVPALRYSLMTVLLVSPTWKAQSNGQWRFTVLLQHFYSIVYSQIYTLMSYIMSTYKFMHVKNNDQNEKVLLVDLFCLGLHVDTFLFSVSSVTLAIYYHIKNR